LIGENVVVTTRWVVISNWRITLSWQRRYSSHANECRSSEFIHTANLVVVYYTARFLPKVRIYILGSCGELKLILTLVYV